MLLEFEKEIRGGMCHSDNRYAKINNKCMKDFDENKYSLYLKNWDTNNVYDLTMSQKLPVNDFKLVGDISEFDESFIKSYNKERDEGYFLEVDVQYPGKLHNFHNDLPFLSKRTKAEKVEKLVANLYDKTEYIIHIRNLKQTLKKVLRVIKCTQKTWLKPYINMNTDLRKTAENDFKKYLPKLMNHSVFDINQLF